MFLVHFSVEMSLGGVFESDVETYAHDFQFY